IVLLSNGSMLMAQTKADNSLFVDTKGNTNVNGDLNVNGNTRVGGILNTSEDTRLGGNLVMKAEQKISSGKVFFRFNGAGFFLGQTDLPAEGISFGMNTIASASNKDLNLATTGTGNMYFKTNGQYGMMINSAGNVSISNTNRNPVNKLELDGDMHMDGHAIYFRQDPNNRNDYIKWTGYNNYKEPNEDRIRISGCRGVELGATCDNSTALTVALGGFVGIGTVTPQVPLHVTRKKGGNNEPRYDSGLSDGNHSLALGWGANVHQTRQFSRGFDNCGILADGDIVTKNVLVATQTSAYSDIRLKKDIVVSSSKQDLETLREIQIVNYKMIDTIANDRSYKKVIAQQIQKVYPNATGVSFKTLPDVFQSAISVVHQKDGLYLMTLAKSQNLKAGDNVELKCGDENDVVVQVAQILSSTAFTVKSPVALDDKKPLFVYGRPATDVLTVDYDALSMLNISATQELAKIIEEQQKQIQLLKKQNTDMALENEKLKTEQARTMNTVMARLSA
ncbi:MAG TPA: tail fiber domain-containing protein, partial [Pedobacter sp.]